MALSGQHSSREAPEVGGVARIGPEGAGPRRTAGSRRTGPNGTEGGGIGGRDWRRPLLPGTGPLSRVHPALAFVAVLVVFAVGVWWGGPAGALLLGVLALAVGGLLAATWPRLSAPDRAARILVLAVLIAIALQRWA
jgi:hypothetical protein